MSFNQRLTKMLGLIAFSPTYALVEQACISPKRDIYA